MIGRFIEWILPLLILAAAVGLLLAFLLRDSAPRGEAQAVDMRHGPTSPGYPDGGAGLLPGAPNGEAVPRPRGIEPATTPDPAQQAADGAPSPKAIAIGQWSPQAASADGRPSALPRSSPLQRPSPNPSGPRAGTAGGAGAVTGPASPAASPDYSACPTPCFVSIDVPGPTLAPLTFGGLHPIQEGWYRGVASGIASHMGYGFPASYLALPIGPGFRVRITGPAGYVVMTSTDAGPALHLQRPPYNRVADLSVSVFVRICGVPASFGLCPVSVVIEGKEHP